MMVASQPFASVLGILLVIAFMLCILCCNVSLFNQCVCMCKLWVANFSSKWFLLDFGTF